ncbi:uncharacterized protein LOC141849264 [Brevipalpus obovatus]|uniref:uncharacterized protein LOC141849264 n=1 Tax=Brevipalpus obovatus TaxID=246614 RepID=UPI003D9E20A6
MSISFQMDTKLIASCLLTVIVFSNICVFVKMEEFVSDTIISSDGSDRESFPDSSALKAMLDKLDKFIAINGRPRFGRSIHEHSYIPVRPSFGLVSRPQLDSILRKPSPLSVHRIALEKFRNGQNLQSNFGGFSLLQKPLD